ncbi:MAG: MFS transporter [Oscillospiraceae bacterium]|nr:MFS transporter [Oscillospiraceae bacterium]
MLADLQMSPEFFGLLFGALTIFAGFATPYQEKLHNTFKNKTLAVLSVPVFLSFIIIGVVTIFEINLVITMVIVIIAFALQYFSSGIYWTLSRKYTMNFTNAKIRTDVLSAGELIEGVGSAIIIFLAGLLLEYYATNMAYLIVGSVGIVLILLVLGYMKSRVGLQPEEYNAKEIKYEEVND